MQTLQRLVNYDGLIILVTVTLATCHYLVDLYKTSGGLVITASNCNLCLLHAKLAKSFGYYHYHRLTIILPLYCQCLPFLSYVARDLQSFSEPPPFSAPPPPLSAHPTSLSAPPPSLSALSPPLSVPLPLLSVLSRFFLCLSLHSYRDLK